jgi:hypothetical protein
MKTLSGMALTTGKNALRFNVAKYRFANHTRNLENKKNDNRG